MEHGRVPRLVRCGRLLAVALLVLAACGDGDDDASPASPDTTDADSTDIAPEDLEEAERRCAERAQDALFTYQPGKQMTEGQAETVEAVASVGDAAPPSTLSGGEPTKSEPVSLECVVEASLVGPDFQIEPEGWQPRSFLETDVITWRWQVKPETSGSALPLSLRLRAFVDAPGADDPIPVGPDDITVTISVESKPKSMGDRWREFWSDPFWGSVSGLAVLLGGFAGTFRLVKKRWPWKRPPPPSTAAEPQPQSPPPQRPSQP